MLLPWDAAEMVPSTALTLVSLLVKVVHYELLLCLVQVDCSSQNTKKHREAWLQNPPTKGWHGPGHGTSWLDTAPACVLF